MRDLECARGKGSLRFVLRGRKSCEREIAAAESKCDMFEQAFELKVTFEEKSAG